MAHTRFTGRVQGQSNDKNWIESIGQEKRYNHAHAVAKQTIGQKSNCPKCQRKSICRDARVTPGNGAKSWWVCQECGHVSTRTITPAKMAEYYAEDAGRKGPA